MPIAFFFYKKNSYYSPTTRVKQTPAPIFHTPPIAGAASNSRRQKTKIFILSFHHERKAFQLPYYATNSFSLFSILLLPITFMTENKSGVLVEAQSQTLIIIAKSQTFQIYPHSLNSALFQANQCFFQISFN
jgi:hypothetical protein